MKSLYIEIWYTSASGERTNVIPFAPTLGSAKDKARQLESQGGNNIRIDTCACENGFVVPYTYKSYSYSKGELNLL